MVGVVGSSPIAPTNANPGKSLIYRGFLFPVVFGWLEIFVEYGKNTESGNPKMTHGDARGLAICFTPGGHEPLPL